MSGPWLPHLLRELTDALGAEAGEACARAYGGQKIYIPAKATAEHRIARAAGLSVMEWLVERYGGNEVSIPLGATSVLEQRRMLARGLIAQGVSIREAARQAGLHLRSVEKMLRREGRPSIEKAEAPVLHYQRDPRQGRLF